MSLKVRLKPLLQNTGKYSILNARCNPLCNTCKEHYSQLDEIYCVNCWRMHTKDGQNTPNKPEERIDNTIPHSFDICNYCTRYGSSVEYLLKNIWNVLVRLSDVRFCNSEIDGATLFTFNYINQMMNSKNVKIYPKILMFTKIFNNLKYNIKKYYDNLNNLMNIRKHNNQYKIFIANTKTSIKKYTNDHQIILVWIYNTLYIIDNDVILDSSRITSLKRGLGKSIYSSIKIKYISFPINVFAEYEIDSNGKISLTSGNCIANSCTQALIIAQNYSSPTHILETLFDKCKYIKYILNDPLITYFAKSQLTLFAMWTKYNSPQWVDYWNVINGKMSIHIYNTKYERMFFIYIKIAIY